ncbi:MAG: hypothetical protein VB038_07625 [Methanobrevibacter sp.]|uniref:hypothetical protein n=1 Tax=Methanobrevibacter sp. TaxID=66852 RepID=UPI002B2197A9|nr:hypothetical protein [Methanobrevibacter sp.]MEA4957580.1 hypothetical protein [Methanobrevibacter sp.]
MIDTEENIITEATSKVMKHNPNSSSVRAVIPKSISAILDTKDGDVVNWKALTKNDKIFVIIEKAE